MLVDLSLVVVLTFGCLDCLGMAVAVLGAGHYAQKWGWVKPISDRDQLRGASIATGVGYGWLYAQQEPKTFGGFLLSCCVGSYALDAGYTYFRMMKEDLEKK